MKYQTYVAAALIGLCSAAAAADDQNPSANQEGTHTTGQASSAPEAGQAVDGCSDEQLFPTKAPSLLATTISTAKIPGKTASCHGENKLVHCPLPQV